MNKNVILNHGNRIKINSLGNNFLTIKKIIMENFISKIKKKKIFYFFLLFINKLKIKNQKNQIINLSGGRL